MYHTNWNCFKNQCLPISTTALVNNRRYSMRVKRVWSVQAECLDTETTSSEVYDLITVCVCIYLSIYISLSYRVGGKEVECLDTETISSEMYDLYVCVRVCMYIYIYKYMYIHIYMHAHTHIYIPNSTYIIQLIWRLN